MGEVMSLAKGLPQVPLLTFVFINKMTSAIDHFQHLQVGVIQTTHSELLDGTKSQLSNKADLNWSQSGPQKDFFQSVCDTWPGDKTHSVVSSMTLHFRNEHILSKLQQ